MAGPDPVASADVAAAAAGPSEGAPGAGDTGAMPTVDAAPTVDTSGAISGVPSGAIDAARAADANAPATMPPATATDAAPAPLTEPQPLVAPPDGDPLAGLYGLRLPPDVPFQGLADLAAALGVGLALAALLAPLVLRLTRPRPVAPDLDSAIAALADQPDDIRIPALLNLAARDAPRAAARFRADLYRPGGLPPAAEIERALREER